MMNKTATTLMSGAMALAIGMLALPAVAQQGGMMTGDKEMGKMMQERYGRDYRGSMGRGPGGSGLPCGPGSMGGMGSGMGGMGGMGMMGGMGGMGMMGGMGSGMSGMGMMGGMGYGMGGMGAMMMLDLSDKQRAKLRAIRSATRKARWNLMGAMMDENDRLRELYAAERRDAKAIGKVYAKLFDLKRQMIESSIENGNKAQAVLTKEQRKTLKDMRRGMIGGGRGMGYGGMMR